MLENLSKAIAAAERDWRNNVGEHDRASLDRMFIASGFARQCPRPWDAKVPDWCGMAVGLWLQDAGLNHPFGRSFLHCLNVEAFFTYGKRSNVNARRLDTLMSCDGKWQRIETLQAGASARRWLDRGAIISKLNSGDTVDMFRAGDVVLLDWSGINEADHITMVKGWDGKTLTTIEGNASGLGPANERRRESVVVRYLDLDKAQNRRLIYGVGRVSPMDFSANLVKP
ncbi:MAG: CHAP domain-containing protein [Planctomycetes bacterium]|nr:CHAP domain-containing protein [Planctomycetota bacterium]